MPVLTTAFRRDAHVVLRRPGQPCVLDEDVAGALAARAHLGPEDCFGLTRMMKIRGRAATRTVRADPAHSTACCSSRGGGGP